MAITREQIWAAADEIDAAGQNPTLAAVRKAVGGGSFTTIQDAMTEWKAKKAAKASPLREPPPASLAERLQELAGDVWTTAMEMATARLAFSGHLADINDWMTNILGGIIGYGLFLLITRSKAVAGFVQRFRWPAREQPVSLQPETGTAFVSAHPLS